MYEDNGRYKLSHFLSKEGLCDFEYVLNIRKGKKKKSEKNDKY